MCKNINRAINILRCRNAKWAERISCWLRGDLVFVFVSLHSIRFWSEFKMRLIKTTYKQTLPIFLFQFVQMGSWCCLFYECRIVLNINDLLQFYANWPHAHWFFLIRLKCEMAQVIIYLRRRFLSWKAQHLFAKWPNFCRRTYGT